MTDTPADAISVTEAAADSAESVDDTAVICTSDEDGIAMGDRYRPEPEIVPTLELPPDTPFTCQITPEFAEFATFARNWTEPPPSVAEAVAGETDMDAVGGPAAGVSVVTPAAPHADSTTAAAIVAAMIRAVRPINPVCGAS